MKLIKPLERLLGFIGIKPKESEEEREKRTRDAYLGYFRLCREAALVPLDLYEVQRHNSSYRPEKWII